MKIAAQVYRTMMAYLSSSGNSDWTMPDGLYRSGGYLYLNGSSGSNSRYGAAPATSSSSSSDSNNNDQNNNQTTEASSDSSSSSSDATTSSNP